MAFGEPHDEDAIEDEVLRRILGYLVAHPDAKDTATGIGEWWIADLRDRMPAGLLQLVLDNLADRGWVAHTHLRSGVVIYGLAKQHLAEIEAFLN